MEHTHSKGGQKPSSHSSSGRPRGASPRPFKRSGGPSSRPAGAGFGGAPRKSTYEGSKPFGRSGVTSRPTGSYSHASPSSRPGSSFGSRTGSSTGAPRRSFSGPSRPSFGRSTGFGGGARRPAFGGGNRNSRSKRPGEYIDVNKFIQKAGPVEAVKTPVKHTFRDFKFSPEIEKNLATKNYIHPTPIQDQAIPHILKGGDVVGLAQTGTGKTAAFLLPMIDKILKNPREKVLILAPTRELAQQIEAEFREFTMGMKLFSTVCVGGMPIFRQIESLRRNPNFVIGTPGRLEDLAERRKIRFEEFQNVVIDEVDHMLDLGFIEPIKNILSKVPKVRQSLMFSATMPPRIRALVSEFLNNPVTVEISSGVTTKNVEQDVIRVSDKSKKMEALEGLLRRGDVSKVLIFIETKRDVDKISRELTMKGFKVDSIHGDKRQRQRQIALKNFKDDHINILVATDVAARGLDINDITHVINYTIPLTHDDYIHRIGRTGRNSKKGFAYTFI